MRSSFSHRSSLAVAGASLVLFVGMATANPAEHRNPANPNIEDLAWIAGHWGGDAFGGQIEEAWFSPRGQGMSGSFRLIQEDLAVMYELLLLEQDDDGEIFYRFKHVSRGWEPWEETRLEYRLTELDGRKATFRSTSDTPPADAPWWFTYESPTGNELLVSIHSAEGGDPLVLSMKRL